MVEWDWHSTKWVGDEQHTVFKRRVDEHLLGLKTSIDNDLFAITDKHIYKITPLTRRARVKRWFTRCSYRVRQWIAARLGFGYSAEDCDPYD